MADMREAGRLAWRTRHQNIMAALSDADAERYYEVQRDLAELDTALRDSLDRYPFRTVRQLEAGAFDNGDSEDEYAEQIDRRRWLRARIRHARAELRGLGRTAAWGYDEPDEPDEAA